MFEVGIPRNLRDVPRLAILREEGSNGDREMAAAFFNAGFQVWDVNTVDLIEAKVDLNDFKGLVFCGGFSFAGSVLFTLTFSRVIELL